jgi:hypothetical protein
MVFVRKPEEKSPLVRHRLRWKDWNWDVGLWTELSWLGIETGGGHL